MKETCVSVNDSLFTVMFESGTAPSNHGLQSYIKINLTARLKSTFTSSVAHFVRLSFRFFHFAFGKDLVQIQTI